MVPQKRLDYGFNFPKAPRSIRGRCARKNSFEDNKLCAFELLAAVAGKLLQESETSVSSNVDHGSCAQNSFVPQTSILEQPDLNELLQTDEHISVLANQALDSDSKPGRDDAVGSKVGDPQNPGDPIEECVNSNMLIKSDNSVQPLYRDPIPNTSLYKQWNTVKLGIRDDDENSFGCNKRSTKVKLFRPQPRTSHRRIRKMLASKYRKMAPKLRSCELYNSRDGMKSFYQYRKRILTQDRCLQAAIKKRKLIDHDTSSNSPEKRVWMDKSSSTIMLERVGGKGHKKAKDPHVKFSIKSFKVPEFYIEVPETASVGSMKTSVMEAVSGILGSGVGIGVVLHGKKVGDDKRTLQQAGICENSNLESLGFTLEPSFTNKQVSGCDADEELARTSSDALIPKRRSRRPFSVGEVEALVEAVEKLGTGRWRDVKMCAFGNADHRTYVDLKDKWKTLVHTADISPHQRRGEPVPQDLLDRVLAAHSYWSLALVSHF